MEFQTYNKRLAIETNEIVSVQGGNGKGGSQYTNTGRAFQKQIVKTFKDNGVVLKTGTRFEVRASLGIPCAPRKVTKKPIESIVQLHRWLYTNKLATHPNGHRYRKFIIEVKEPLNCISEEVMTKENKIEYKFNEGKLIEEFKKYIDSTYDSHYSKNKFQATEFIIDGGHGTGFCIGNVLKYGQRYGKKGSSADARKDLMKVLHYALIQLHVHDREIGSDF